MLAYEKQARKQGFCTIAGIDEAGRGPLAGPVTAAACILPPRLNIKGINDSKQLTPAVRDSLYTQLTEHPDVKFGIGIIDINVIDAINIYQATIQAMLEAVRQLSTTPDYLLVDGLKLPHPTIPCEQIIKGDQLSLSIAAASIIAKVTRDRIMENYHVQWPEYGFDAHKGYATPQHLSALKSFGPCPIHRKSFEPVKSLCLEAVSASLLPI